MDSFDIGRRHPTHQQRLAAEKQVNVYFIPGTDKAGKPRYAYVVSSALLHTQFMQAVQTGAIPDFAVVVEEGSGLPPENAIKDKMLALYGFEHKET